MKRVALLLALLAAGCGETAVVEESPVVVKGSSAPAGEQGGPDDAVRIAVVTHGQASSPFWAIVRNGVEAAARRMDVQVSYRAPEVYSLDRMKTMVRQAVASRPDGLVVSIPEQGLAPAIRRATRAGIPVVSMNSGSDAFRELGILAHVGQPEQRAGLLAGRRLARAGVRRALCVNQQVGNQGLDARCRGLGRAMRRAGGQSLVIGVDDQSAETPRRLTAAIENGRIDGLLAVNATTGLQAAEAIRRAGREDTVIAGTFDLGPDVLRAVEQKRLAFAVDQQPYLQGYWPVAALAQRARFGLFLGEGKVLPTGPNFVTPENAARVLELSERSIR